MEPPDRAIDEAVRILKAGGLVAVPTETVYGLAGHALNPEAVRAIFQVKGRPFLDPLIVHLAWVEQIPSLAYPVPGLEKLAQAYWPGPLTVVLRKTERVPDIVTAGQPTVAIRLPAHLVFRAVLEKSNLPLAAPSANPFGYISPTRAQHVSDGLGQSIPLILDGGPCLWGIESTVLDMSDNTPVVLRQGPISVESLEETLSVKVTCRTVSASNTSVQKAPGQLSRHYSPHTRVRLFEPNEGPADDYNPDEDALILQKRPEHPPAHCYWFSESEQAEEVARSLFDLMRNLDQQRYPTLWIEKAVPEGLGLAINDRLTRAAAR